MAMCATVDAAGSGGFNEMSATIHKFPAPATKQSLQQQIARIAPPGSSKYQIEVHSSDGHPIRVYPRKSEGRTYYSLRPFQSPYMCPIGMHVIRFFSDANERLEVPDDAYPMVRVGPRPTDAEDLPASDSDPSVEWREIRRERAQQEVELGTQQLLLNQQNINEHGDVTRSNGQLLRRHQEYVAASTELALETNRKIAEMNDRMLAQGEKFLETTSKILSHFMEVAEKVRVPAPPTDWAKITESVFNGLARVGSTLITAAKGGEALPPGAVAAGARRMAAPSEPENKLPAVTAAQPLGTPEAEEPAPRPIAAHEAPAAAAAPAATETPAPTPTPQARADQDQEPPDPPAAQPKQPASASESEPTPAPAETRPKLTFRQRLRQSVRNMLRYFLAFSPAEYVGMLDAPEEIAEYMDALSTLAVPHEELLAGLRA
jgi:hypothetical protein